MSKAVESEEFIKDLAEMGYAASVATNETLIIVRTFVDSDDLDHAVIVPMTYGYPLIMGGRYNGHRLVHHSVAVEEGQRIIGTFGRPD